MKRLLSSKAPAQAPPVVPGRDADEGSAEARAGQGRNLTSYLPPVLEGIVALGGAFVVSVFLTWPLLLEFGDHIYGLGGDSTGTMAGLPLWADEIGYHISGVSHVASAGAPFGYDQGNGVNLQSAFVFFPAYLVTEVSDEIVAYNIVVLAGLAFSGAAMYWLVAGSAAAAWSRRGPGSCSSSFRGISRRRRATRPSPISKAFPLLLLAVFAWYRKPGLPRALLVAAASAVLWTTSGYFGFMGLVGSCQPSSSWPSSSTLAWRSDCTGRSAVSPFPPQPRSPCPWSCTESRRAARARTESRLRAKRSGARASTAPAHGSTSSRRTAIRSSATRSASGSSRISTGATSRRPRSTSAGSRSSSLPAGSCGRFVKRSQLRPELRFATLALAATVVTGLVFSLPTPFFRTEIPTPVRLIWEVAPQFRVPARFVALVMAALVPLAALGARRSSPRRRSAVQPRALAAVAAGAVCVVAGVSSFLELSISPPTTLTRPQRRAAGVRKPCARRLAGWSPSIPWRQSNQAINSDYLFWQRAHDRRIVNGAPLGTFADAVGQTLVDPTTPGTAEALAALGASVAVVRPAEPYAFTGGPTVAATTSSQGISHSREDAERVQRSGK